MGRREAMIAVMLVLVSTATTRYSLAQQRKMTGVKFADKLNPSVDVFDAAGMPMAKAAVHLAYEYKVSLAVEYINRDSLHESLHLRLRGKSLREVMAAIVASLPDYRVDFSRGLVDIYSPAARRDSSNPLSTVIRRYDADELDTHFADAQLLCDLGRQLRPNSGCGGSVAGDQWGTQKITLHVRNKPVYEVLNAIVAQNGQALWVPLQQPEKSSPFIRNFWYIYPLEPSFEGLVVQQLEMLLKGEPPTYNDQPDVAPSSWYNFRWSL